MPPGRRRGRRPPPPPRGGRASRLLARAALATVSFLVLAFTGYSWAAMQGLVNGLTMADVLGTDSGDKPADGGRDILLVGMDSRTDAQGNPLSEEMLAKLRAGVADGELNTDTLIFVRIPNDGDKAVAISIPRDSYVSIPGFGTHKINSAYARGKAAARRQLQADGVTDSRELEVRSNQEGAKTLIATIEKLTGANIDNYASINLLGFYDITQAVGGVDVCLKQPVNDPYSGARFDAGRQTVSGFQALAFVRQRHGLLHGDLDRVVRQQVFMAGLARKVLSAGTLADPGKLNDLVTAIQKSVVVNKGWDILSFAQQLRGLSGGQIQFTTIPVVNPEYRTDDDGLAVQVDPDQVRRFVRNLSGKPPQAESPPASAPQPADITVDVYNAAGIDGLAGSVAQSLTEKGFAQGEVANAAPRDTSVIRVAPGETAAGEAVSTALGGGIDVEESPEVTSGHAEVLLAPDHSGSRAGAPAQPVMQQRVAPLAQSTPPGDGDPGAPPPITADGVTCVN